MCFPAIIESYIQNVKNFLSKNCLYPHNMAFAIAYSSITATQSRYLL